MIINLPDINTNQTKSTQPASPFSLQIEPLWNQVWEWRRINQDWFPTPEPWTCIEFAVTEFGEFVDAAIRERSSEFVRASAKHLSAQHEMGQVLFMLLSALPKFESLVNDATIQSHDLLFWLGDLHADLMYDGRNLSVPRIPLTRCIGSALLQLNEPEKTLTEVLANLEVRKQNGNP